jgi:hypothetical protein
VGVLTPRTGYQCEHEFWMIVLPRYTALPVNGSRQLWLHADPRGSLRPGVWGIENAQMQVVVQILSETYFV